MAVVVIGLLEGIVDIQAICSIVVVVVIAVITLVIVMIGSSDFGQRTRTK